jgi:hypothetical protein
MVVGFGGASADPGGFAPPGCPAVPWAGTGGAAGFVGRVLGSPGHGRGGVGGGCRGGGLIACEFAGAASGGREMALHSDIRWAERLLYGQVVCVGCSTPELIVMKRRLPTTEIRILLRTILSAGVLAMLLACAGTAAGAMLGCG